ncbi:MAG: sugar phosphate isomerase/epimerase family protein [Thermofilaceae archaeon]
MARLRIGVTIWSLGLTSDWGSLEKQLATAREIGVEGVQLWAVDYGPWPSSWWQRKPCLLDPDRCGRECRKRVVELVESYGLKITGFCAQLSSKRRFGGFDDPDGLEERVKKTCRVLEMAAEMGAPIVTTHPGVIPEDRTDPTYKLVKNAVLEVAKCAENVGSFFCIETGMEPAHALRRFLEDLGSPAVRVNYDPANLLRFGAEEVVRGVELLGPWIVHTHAKDHNPQTGSATVGEGLVPWRDYLLALGNAGFTGWLALEDETGRNVVDSLRRGRAFLERLIGEPGL